MPSISLEAALSTFGFSEAPSWAIVQQRYHQLALEYHPDKAILHGCSSAEATTKFQRLVAAYNVLKQRTAGVIGCCGSGAPSNISHKCVSCGNTALLMNESRCEAAGIIWTEYSGHPAGLRTCMRCKISQRSVLTRAQACILLGVLGDCESILDQLHIEGRTFRDASETYFWRQDLDKWSRMGDFSSFWDLSTPGQLAARKNGDAINIQLGSTGPDNVRKIARKRVGDSPEKLAKPARKRATKDIACEKNLCGPLAVKDDRNSPAEVEQLPEGTLKQINWIERIEEPIEEDGFVYAANEKITIFSDVLDDPPATKAEGDFDAHTWSCWKRTLDDELRLAGGELPWNHLRDTLVQRYHDSSEFNGMSKDLLACKALAAIPEAYLSNVDEFVRIPFRKRRRWRHGCIFFQREG